MRTPIDTLRALESAYERRDLEAAVSLKDFTTEAELMLQKIDPGVHQPQDLISKTAEVLELTFRSEIEQDGFPSFAGMTLEIIAEEVVDGNFVVLVERSTNQTGQIAEQHLLVSRKSGEWRIVGLVDDETT